jgi:hypothetical protein
MHTLWAISAFFNPARFNTRLANYRLFRQHLSVPLLTVELSNDGSFQLTNEDADILVQVSSSCVVWQKERLLNLAVRKLPADVRHVAWLDCDVIFEDINWPIATVLMLNSHPIGQPFTTLYEPGYGDRGCATVTRMPAAHSLAYTMATQSNADIAELLPHAVDTVRAGGGFAWAARRELLERFGLYDAMILGGGDRTISAAAYGRFSDPIASTLLNKAQQRHYLNWAQPFFAEVRGRVGFVKGNLVHLWHGSLENRKYLQRHKDLLSFDFNPSTDLVIDSQGCWDWRTPKPALQRYIKQYFQERMEDDV